MGTATARRRATRGQTTEQPPPARQRTQTRARSARTSYRYRRGLRVPLGRLLLTLGLLLLVWRLTVHLRPGTATPEARPLATAAPAALAPAAPTPRPTPWPDMAMEHPPSLDAAQADAILAAYHSPLQGHGKELVAFSRRYRIDNAIALAFFVMESRAGTQGEAVLTRSFGNLRPMPGQPELDGYRHYRTWIEGAGEWFSLIRTLYLDRMKLRTVDEVIPTYAPASDNNDPRTMIAGIHQLVTCWRGALDACPNSPARLRELVAAHYAP